jgi:hypothetical protein
MAGFAGAGLGPLPLLAASDPLREREPGERCAGVRGGRG